MNPRNIGAAIHHRLGLLAGSVTAGGSGDDTLRNGPNIDLVGDYEPGNRPLSAVATVGYSGAVADGQTATIELFIQTSDDSNFGSGVEVLEQSEQIFPASADSGILELPINLSGALRYVRMRFGLNLSAANTDIVTTFGIWTLGGQAYEPQETFGAGVDV